MGWFGAKQPLRQRPSDNLRRQSTKPVFSYYSSSEQKRSEPEKVINLEAARRFRLIPTILAVGIIVLSILYSLTLSSKPTISFSQGIGSPYRDANGYIEAVEEILKSQPAYRTKLTVNTGEVEQALLERFPELSAAALRLPILGRRPSLVLDISPPALIITSGNRSYVLNGSGRAVSELSNLDPETKKDLLVLSDQSGLNLSVGKQAVTSETIGFIMMVAAQLKAQSISISQLTLPTSANELDIRLSGENYFIKTDVSGDARKQIGSYLAVRDYLNQRGQKPAEYVDVRVEEKVFYK